MLSLILTFSMFVGVTFENNLLVKFVRIVFPPYWTIGTDLDRYFSFVNSDTYHQHDVFWFSF